MRKTLGIFALLMLGIVITAGAVAAWGGLHFLGNKDDADTMKTAIENNDFASWKTTMEAQLTEENFQQLVEKHKGMPEGKEGAGSMQGKIMQGKGMQRNGSGMDGMPGNRMGNGMPGRNCNPEVEEALESGDFEAWKTAHESMDHQPPFELTEENFNLMVEMHQAKGSGDFEKMQELREQLGLGARQKQGGYWGKGR